MTIAKFRRLPLPKRALTVWKQATFLACMDAGKAGRSLYFLHGFYVELIYDYQSNRALGVVAFRDGWHLVAGVAAAGKYYRATHLVVGHLTAGIPIQGMKRSTSFTLLGKTCMLAVLLLGACTKENDPAPARPACKILSSTSGNFATQYTYDGADRLIESVTNNGTRKQSGATYEYNQQGQVIKYIQQDYRYDAESNVTVTIRTYTPEYNEKAQMSGYQLITTSTNSAIAPSTSTSTYEYDSQGNRTKVTTHSSSGSASVDLHEYKDSNCIKSIFQAGEAHELAIVYERYLDQEYKARTMPHLSIIGPSVSKNMVKKSTRTSTSSGIVSSTEHSYEYNDKGYPVKTTVINNIGTTSPITSVSTVEYACQ